MQPTIQIGMPFLEVSIPSYLATMVRSGLPAMVGNIPPQLHRFFRGIDGQPPRIVPWRSTNRRVMNISGWINSIYNDKSQECSQPGILNQSLYTGYI